MAIKSNYDKGYDYMTNKKLIVKFTFEKDALITECDDTNNDAELMFALSNALVGKLIELKAQIDSKTENEFIQRIINSINLLLNAIGHILQPTDPATGSGGTFGFGKQC